MLPKLPTIEEAGRLMWQKELTPLDLVEHCLGRIAQFEDRIHAWVLVDEDGARKEARRQTEMLARGEDLGPLHGIPIGIKDIIDVALWQTKCGSKLRENVAPTEKDATVVANLRKAGAIILGKTVTTEFACFDPPPTRNPWNLDHTPGGSSSGSAAAVAMEMCMAALGTQTGGSIIRPAAYCGVCGLKPGSFFHVGGGVMPLTLHLDHVGPIARSVADVSTMAQGTLSSWDSWFNIRDEGPPYHFGVCEPFFKEHSSPEVWKHFESAVKRVRASGCQVEAVGVPDGFAQVHVMHRRVMAAEAAAIHRQEFTESRKDYSPHVARLIEEGLALPAIDYADALFHRERFKSACNRLFSPRTDMQLDAILIPATPTVAPTTESTGDPVFNSPWSYSRHPSATIPIAVSAEGLPIGMQIVGLIERDTVELTRACETAVRWDQTPLLLRELR
ncbi:MAG TPA: amidase [Pirellulaceae bacterium]|nr:amidase [Pirellulaceae bacterium]